MATPKQCCDVKLEGHRTGGLPHLPGLATIVKKVLAATKRTKKSSSDDIEQLKENLKKTLGCADFLSTCKAVGTTLEDLNKEYHGELFDDHQFKLTVRQSSMKETSISVSGCHNTGKSTLLNAILNGRLLPTKQLNETCVQVTIRHDAKVHEKCPFQEGSASLEAHCEKCPELHLTYLHHEPDSWTDIEGKKKGENSIRTRLQKLNYDVRKSTPGDRDPIPECTIKTNVPVLAHAPPQWTVHLVDTPGFGEDDPYIAQFAEASMQSSSAYVYIINTSDVGGDANKKYFLQLRDNDKDVFRDRLIVAVTKFDTQYTTNPCESDDVLSMDDVKQVTVEYIRKAVGPGVPVSEDIVVPLSGLWAHTARELAKYPPRNYQYDESHSSHRFLRIAKEYLQKYPSSTGGECDHGAALDILQSEEIADRLEEASGIRELEARIKHMSRMCVSIWIHKMRADFLLFLKSGANKLTENVTATIQLLEEHNAQVEKSEGHQRNIASTRGQLEAKMDFKVSVVHKELSDLYDQDVEKANPQQKGRKKIDELLQEFTYQCNAKIENTEEQFGPQQFQDDLEKFLKGASKELEETFNSSCHFQKVYAALMKNVSLMTEQLTVARSDAQMWCHGKQQVTCTGIMSSTGTGALQEVLKAPNLAKLKQSVGIPNVSLAILDIIMEWLWSLFASVEPCEKFYRKKSDLTGSIRHLRKLLCNECDTYFVKIKPNVIKYFFGSYCKQTKERLEAFDTEFQSDIKHATGALCKLRNTIDMEAREVEKLQVMIDHLQTLSVQVAKQAEEYEIEACQ